MSSPEIGASTVRTMYYLSIICARRSIYIANPYFVPDAAAHRRAGRGEATRRRRARSWSSGDPQRQLAGAPQQRPRLFGRLLEAGIEILEYNRTMLHHKTMVVDGVWCDGRHDQLRQPIVRPQRREQRVRLRRGAGAAAARHVRAPTWRAAIASIWRRWKRRGVWQRAQELLAAFLEEQV